MKQKLSVSLTLALIMAMLVTSVGLADNLVGDGDGLVPVGNNPTLNLGTICLGQSKSGTVLLAISRQGSSTGTNTFENNASISLSAGTPSASSLSSSFSDASINLPSNWTGVSNGTISNDYASASVTANTTGSTIGAKTGTIQYSAQGDNSGGDPITRTVVVTINWTVLNCVQDQTITVTTAAPVSAVYGSSFPVAATASSGLPVDITTGGVCSGSGSNSTTVTMNSGIGTCTVYYNQAGNASYNAAPQVTNTTSALKADATVTVNGYTGVYDGAAHGATGSATGVGGVTLGGLDLGASFTDVPGGTANWTFSGGDNYNDQSGSSPIVISEAPVTATAGSGSSDYDGSAKSPSACEVTGLYKGDLTCVNDPASVGPDAGLYEISPVVSGTGLSNFAVTQINGSYTINKAATTTTVTCSAGPFTFNGFAQEPCTATVTGPGGLNMPLTVSYSDNINAGIATASASHAESANYLGSSDSKTFTINKAPVTATAGSGSSVFDGSAKSPSACVVSGDYTGDLTCANNPASVGPDAGAYAISPVVSGTGLSNFEVTPVNGSYTIDKADATCTVNGWTGYYDGADHGATGSCTGVGGVTLSGLDLGGSFTNVPGGTAYWTFNGGTNYHNQSGSVAIVIDPWTLLGFYQPVDIGASVWNTVKGGSTVPLKFEVFVGGMELTDTTTSVQSLQAYTVACTGGSEDAIETVSTGNTSLRYDWTSGQFIFNWQTPKQPSKCYKVTMTAFDGSKLTANFKLK